MKSIINFIKNSFKQKHTAKDINNINIERQRQSEEKLKEEKSKWEAHNELLKKRDACNLHTSHLAFHGTYEEYIAEKNKDYLKNLSQMSFQIYQQSNNPYNINPHIQRSSCLDGIIGGFF